MSTAWCKSQLGEIITDTVAFFAHLLIISVVAASTSSLFLQRERQYAEHIRSREDFDHLARVYYRGRFDSLPHVMFVIDRRDAYRVYYVDSNAYRFHKDFVNGTYLSLERGRAFYENNYLKPNRRFLLGTVAYRGSVDRFTFEFWEGDRLERDLLSEAYLSLSRTFFAPLSFKANSPGQEEAASQAGNVPLFAESAAARNAEYQPLNLGSGIGQLRIVERVTAETILDRNQIVVLKEVPVHLTPVSGIVTTGPASLLSHVNMLARAWLIPNAYIKNANTLFGPLEGKYVRLEVRENDYVLEPADVKEVEERQRHWAKRTDLVTPRADIRYGVLTDLARQRARDVKRFGAKSANLGEVVTARLPDVVVPIGFTVPFRFYEEFVQQNRLAERIREAAEEDRFVHDATYRKARLTVIRQWIQNGHHDPGFRRSVLEKAHREYGGKSLFVRSSTNAEDLPDFSGAGLYTTVPNVRTGEQLMEAIKAVWASIWNYEAYEAREGYGMNHFGVYPAVIIQEGIPAESAGVVVTSDPFNSGNRAAIYINAKRGLGIKVVEGRRVAEQVIYDPNRDSVRLLTRSDEDTMLAFDERGGVKEVRIEPNRSVLTDSVIRRLARAALRIRRVFNGREQDIEWVFARGKLYIVQSRPYVASSGG